MQVDDIIDKVEKVDPNEDESIRFKKAMLKFVRTLYNRHKYGDDPKSVTEGGPGSPCGDDGIKIDIY